MQHGSEISGLESHLGFWLRFVSNHVSGRFRTRVEENGVTVSEWVALRTLYDVEAATARTLIDALGMTKGAVSKVVSSLERKKLVRRAHDAEDARAQHLTLTPAGRRLVPKLAAIADENDAHFFGGLTEKARRDVTAALQTIVRAHALTEVPTE